MLKLYIYRPLFSGVAMGVIGLTFLFIPGCGC